MVKTMYETMRGLRLCDFQFMSSCRILNEKCTTKYLMLEVFFVNLFIVIIKIMVAVCIWLNEFNLIWKDQIHAKILFLDIFIIKWIFRLQTFDLNFPEKLLEAFLFLIFNAQLLSYITDFINLKMVLVLKLYRGFWSSKAKNISLKFQNFKSSK